MNDPIHPDTLNNRTCGDVSALLHELDALRADALRWRYFRDECDDGDKLHMIAEGTARYDATIDALAAKEK